MPIVTMLLCLWAGVQALTVAGVVHSLRHLPTDRQTADPGGAVVILSVRDDWRDDTGLIAALGKQDASDFRLLIATSGQCAHAQMLAAAHPEWIATVAAGVADDEGQKVHKLRAALRSLGDADRWLIFIDSDIVPPARLIGRLVFPLVRDKADIVTGYRLLLPSANPVLALVGAIEMQIVTFPRMAGATMPWGGAMAMRRETAERLDLEQALAGRLSDDMTIGMAGWRAKLRLRPVRDLLVPSPLGGRGSDALAFGLRQYRHVSTNSAGMWQIATGFVAVNAVGWVWAMGWGGWPAVAIGYLAGWMRALLRARLIRQVVEGDAQARSVRRSLCWDALAPFAVTWAHLAIQMVAVASNHIRWGGYDYWVRRGRVIRMRRTGERRPG